MSYKIFFFNLARDVGSTAYSSSTCLAWSCFLSCEVVSKWPFRKQDAQAPTLVWEHAMKWLPVLGSPQLLQQPLLPNLKSSGCQGKTGAAATWARHNSIFYSQPWAPAARCRQRLLCSYELGLPKILRQMNVAGWVPHCHFFNYTSALIWFPKETAHHSRPFAPVKGRGKLTKKNVSLCTGSFEDKNKSFIIP